MASSRRVFPTVFLVALIATGWCSMASAVSVDDNALDPQDGDIKVANGGRIGPGLSLLVAIAENILRKYGVTKTFADVLDLDAGLISIASAVLNTNGEKGVLGLLGQPQNLQNWLNREVGQLETVAKRLQSIVGDLEDLPVNVLCQIMELTSQLQSIVGILQKLVPTTTGQGQLQARLGTLQDLLNNVQEQLQQRGLACA